MDKYYTPTIEEFHVGFEYEVTMMSSGGLIMMNFKDNTNETISEPNHKIWEKTVVTSTMADTGKMITMPFNDGTLTYEDTTLPYDHRSIEDIVSLLKSDQIRVKYLDQEDIESLGFEGSNANSVYFRKGKYRLVHWRYQGRDITIIEEYPGGEEIIIKKALIKNKSELKRILRHLIIE